MKVSYDVKTDFLAVRLRQSLDSVYVEDFENGIDVVLSERNDEVIGYDLYNASKTILKFKEVTSSEKLAVLIKIHRKINGMTQEQLHIATGIPLPTIKVIEKGEKDTSIQNMAKIKRVLVEIDLNSISISKLAG